MKEKKLSKNELIDYMKQAHSYFTFEPSEKDRQAYEQIKSLIESSVQGPIKINQDCIANIQCPHCREKIKISYLKTFFSQESGEEGFRPTWLNEWDGISTEGPSEAEMEEVATKWAHKISYSTIKEILKEYRKLLGRG